MMQRAMSGAADPNSVRKVVSVKAPLAVAWLVFTEKMGSWWPLATHKIGKAKAVDALIEPRVGGRWYERGDDGSTCDWGRVLIWEPPQRLVLSWEISANWQHAPTLQTEIEVRFIAEGKDATRVELEHRHLELRGVARRDARRLRLREGLEGPARRVRSSRRTRIRHMTGTSHPPIKLFQFPRMFGIPNLSPFCCKLEIWLRITGIPYEVVDTSDPRKGPKGKLPFIEDDGRRIADTSLIVDHLARTRGVDLDAHLDTSQRAIALLVQRTLEEHYAFVVLYTHFIRAEGWRHTCATFDTVPAIVRPLVAGTVRGRMRQILWAQGVLRHSDADIIEAALRDWRAVLAVMSGGPFFFGEEPTGLDAVVFGALATTLLTPIESPIRDFLRSQPACVAYAERMRARFFPELAGASSQESDTRDEAKSHAVHMAH